MADLIILRSSGVQSAFFKRVKKGKSASGKEGPLCSCGWDLAWRAGPLDDSVTELCSPPAVIEDGLVLAGWLLRVHRDGLGRPQDWFGAWPPPHEEEESSLLPQGAGSSLDKGKSGDGVAAVGESPAATLEVGMCSCVSAGWSTCILVEVLAVEVAGWLSSCPALWQESRQAAARNLAGGANPQVARLTAVPCGASSRGVPF